MNKNIKKIGKAVAGSALLVGATLTGAAGLASAASGSQDLGDYPTPFVSDDGQVQSTVVVGESAKTVDVVGAINVAGSLGNAAFSEETQAVSGSGGSWSASNGAALDTSNKKLYLGDNTQKVRQTLTGDDLSALETAEFEEDDGDTFSVENYLYVGQQNQQFGNSPRALKGEDPVLYVNNPTSTPNVDNPSSYLYKLQANMGEDLDVSSAQVTGQEISLFGNTCTIFDSSDQDTLALFGSSQTLSMENGDSQTFTLDGNEHTIEVVAVNSDGVAYRVDGGSLKQKTDGSTFTVDNTDVRINNVVNLQDDNGYADFEVGSAEVVLNDGSRVEVEGEKVDGTRVSLSPNTDSTISSVEIAFGAQDRDRGYVAAGETHENPLFDIEFHYEGLNPAAEDGENVEFGTSGSDSATVGFTDDSGNSASLNYAFSSDPANAAAPTLADQDGDAIHVAEGAAAARDEYVAADAGGFAHLYEVLDVNVDEGDSANDNDGEATVELQDVVSGSSVEVDIKENSNVYQKQKVIDGQTYYVSVDDANNEVSLTWGDNAAAGNTGSTTTVYPALDTETGSAVALTADVSPEVPTASDADVTADEFSNGPSTVTLALEDDATGEDDKVTVSGPNNVNEVDFDGVKDVTVTDGGSNDADGVQDGTVTLGFTAAASGDLDATVTRADGSGDYTVQSIDDGANEGSATVSVSPVSRNQALQLPSTESTDDKYASATYSGVGGSGSVEGGTGFTVGQLGYSWDGTTLSLADAKGTNNGNNVAVATVLPEDNSDSEQAYVVSPDVDGSNDEVVVQDAAYTGATRLSDSLESNSDVTASYDGYGAYSEFDSDGQQSFTLNLPGAQATTGVAVTGNDGSVSASGSAGSVTTQTPTGFPDAAALDSDSNIGSKKTSDNLILVGGPAVNSLTQELADGGKTQGASDYSEGSAMVQLVNNAFTEEQDALVVAGYSGADTRQAANYISNYADNADDLAGQTQVELSTQQTQSAE